MSINPNYLEMVAKKLDAMNKAPGGKTIQSEVPKHSDIMDIMGKAALEFLERKNKVSSPPDPLFPDRNSY